MSAIHGLRGSAILMAISFVILVSLCFAGATSFSPQLLAHVKQQFGEDAWQRILDWQSLINHVRGRDEAGIILSVNDFINRVNFVSDEQHWKRADYWATPVEFLASNGGDCEDFSIAKYFTLRELGVPDTRLRITYVKAAASPWLVTPQAHMVLAYYPSPEAVPLILDNLTGDILPATLRGDLTPVYSFNGTGLWVAKQQGSGYTSLGNPGRINFWSDMNIRLQHERAFGESYSTPAGLPSAELNEPTNRSGADTLGHTGP